MDWQQRLRDTILSTIIRDFPQKFWEEAKRRTQQTYLDVFYQVQLDPNVVAEQRLDKLYQDRHFRMEHLLAILADEHGLAQTSTLLTENNRHYVYATKGNIGLTQVYVPAIGSMPKPARFRERHAALSNIPKFPRLDLGDEPPEVLLGKDFYGLLAHNPVGKRFTEREQRLGMMQFCIPVNDCSRWAVELAIEEIVSAYQVAAPAEKVDRRLPWKKRGEEEGKK